VPAESDLVNTDDDDTEPDNHSNNNWLLSSFWPWPLRKRLQFPYRWTEACRGAWFYKGVAEYFPIRLYKTVDLPVPSIPGGSSSDEDDKNNESNNPPYIFLYHPHGVISMGGNTALALNGCGFDRSFPGIRRYGVALNVSFWGPFFREWMLAMGYLSANRHTLAGTLENGNSIVLVPGGAAEALHAHRDNFRLHIRDRRGFVRLALETGALPVPCLGFGENEAFETYYPEPTVCPVEGRPTSAYLRLQQRICKLFSFSTPILTSILPNRRPIHVVVGGPIRFTPDDATVDECHEQYLEAVRWLFEENKHKYGYGHMEIEFV